MVSEKAVEDEVHAAYKSFKKSRRRAKKKGEELPLDSIIGQAYNLYSSEYMKRFDPNSIQTAFNATKRISFYSLDEDPGRVNSDLYLNGSLGCYLESFTPPTRGRRKDVKIRCSKEKGEYDMKNQVL